MRLASAGCTTPIRPSWPFSLLSVPSPDTCSAVSAAATRNWLPGRVEQRVAVRIRHRAIRLQLEPTGAGQHRPSLALHGEEARPRDRQVERIGRVQSAAPPPARGRSHGPACRPAPARPATESVPVCRLSQSANRVRPVLKPGVSALARLLAVTSIARCCATRRDRAIVEAFCMARHPDGSLPISAKRVPPVSARNERRFTWATPAVIAA